MHLGSFVSWLLQGFVFFSFKGFVKILVLLFNSLKHIPGSEVKITADSGGSHKIKDGAPWKQSYDRPKDRALKAETSLS